jgi:hypothetical protein
MAMLESATDLLCVQSDIDDVKLARSYATADVSPPQASSAQPHRKDYQFAFARIHGDPVLVQSKPLPPHSRYFSEP